jgi:2-isopropylmalate synthase
MTNTKPKHASERVYIFDTTLRDGDQASGFHFKGWRDKLRIARQLSELGVDIIEAGFAISSPEDARAVNEIAKDVGIKGGPVICSLSRAVYADIEAAAKAIEPAYKQRIHTFIATSDIHLSDKLKKRQEEIIEMAVKAIRKAKSYVHDVEFSCEDFGRTRSDYAIEVVSEAIKAGATTINLPDTVGWLTPSQAYRKVKTVIEVVRERGLDAIFSVHNHNDLGMATANTIEEIRAGARQAEVTINGIGERAGNTALEEVVAALKTKMPKYHTKIRTPLVGKTSRLVSKLTGKKPQANKSVVGENAFAHEAGIHQDGMEKSARTYEIMNPKDWGMKSRLTFGPRSGRRGLNAKYHELGIEMTPEELGQAYTNFKKLADRKGEVDDADLLLAKNGGKNVAPYYGFVSYHPVKTSGKDFVLDVRVREGKEVFKLRGRGDGQIDAAFNAVTQLLPYDIKLKDFRLQSKGPGSYAKGGARVDMTRNGWEVIGEGSDNDSVTSAIKSFVSGCNRIRYLERQLGHGLKQ